MAKVTMTLEGMDALKRAVTEAPKELRRLSSAAVRESTFAVADRMRQLAPHREGTLLGAIEARVAIGTGLTGRVDIGADGWYWRFHEYGTKHMAARPFVRPATESESPVFQGRFDQVGRDLEQFWAR